MISDLIQNNNQVLQFISLRCLNAKILLIKMLAAETHGFAGFIQTLVKTTHFEHERLCNRLSNFKCLMAKRATFDSQLDHVFMTNVNAQLQSTVSLTDKRDTL